MIILILVGKIKRVILPTFIISKILVFMVLGVGGFLRLGITTERTAECLIWYWRRLFCIFREKLISKEIISDFYTTLQVIITH